jgi:hypothetical protein
MHPVQPEADAVPPSAAAAPEQPAPAKPVETKPVEVGGRNGPDPVRYGDWEKNGRCIDF